MTTYPQTGDPMSAGTEADGTTISHQTEHGRTIGVWENVKHFGAAGDGVTDDTAAINTAVAYVAAHGKSLYWPAGTYLVSSTISLTNLNFQHWVGGHKGQSGLIQFAMAPSVMIYMPTGSGPAVYIDGGASHAGGGHTFENIIFWGNEQGFWSDQAARVRFKNCGFKSSSVGGTDACGLFMSRSFWFTFESCTFHCTDATSQPAVIFRAEAGTNAQNCGLMSFKWCVWAGGTNQFDINVVAPEDIGNLQFYECFTEGGTGSPFITFTENTGSSTAYGIVLMRFQNVQVADSSSGNVPIMKVNAAHATVRYPVFEQTDNPGQIPLKMTAGSVTGARLIRTGIIVDSAGTTPAGAAVYNANNGLIITGTGAAPDTTSLLGGSDVGFAMAKVNELHASFGITSAGRITWGQGGASGTWDTNLYRSAADTLKTDDAFVSGAALTASKAFVQTQIDLVDVATVAVNAALGTHFYLQTSSSRTIAAPTNPTQGQVIHVYIHANAGGVVTTFDAAYHKAGAWVDPASGKGRSITFAYVSRAGAGLEWTELSRTAADIT